MKNVFCYTLLIAMIGIPCFSIFLTSESIKSVAIAYAVFVGFNFFGNLSMFLIKENKRIKNVQSIN